MKAINFIPLLFLSFFLFACQSQQNENDHATTDANDQNTVTAGETLPADVEDQLQRVLNHYFDLKEHLVEAQSAEAMEKAQQIQQTISEVNTDADNMLRQHLNNLQQHANAIAGTNDVERQRVAFEPLSDELFSMLNHYKFNDNAVYRQFCPMAFDDRGAYWLSNQEQIRNPYFGHQMLRCGRVEQTIN